MNSRRLLTAGCFLTACSMSFTFAGENDKGEKKETQSEPKPVAAVIEVRETGESAEKPITAQAKRIVIAINGDTKEFELNNSPDESKKEAKKMNSKEGKRHVQREHYSTQGQTHHSAAIGRGPR